MRALLTAAVLAPFAALAQGVPGWPPNYIVPPAEWDRVLGGKVDMGSPLTMVQPGARPCDLIYSAVPNVQVDSGICFASTSAASTGKAGTYHVNLNFEANAAAPAAKDQVGLYVRGISTAGGSGIWAINTVTDIIARPPGAARPGSSAGYEMDVGTEDCDAGLYPGTTTPSCPTWSKGLWITGGSAYPITDAILVTGVGAGPLYHYGLRFLGPMVKDVTLQDASNATVSVQVLGAHTNGVDLSGATYSNAALLLGAGHKLCLAADCSYVASVKNGGLGSGLSLDAGGTTMLTVRSDSVQVRTLVLQNDLTVAGNVTRSGAYSRVLNLPSSDPHVVGQEWRAPSGQLMISAGP